MTIDTINNVRSSCIMKSTEVLNPRHVSVHKIDTMHTCVYTDYTHMHTLYTQMLSHYIRIMERYTENGMCDIMADLTEVSK